MVDIEANKKRYLGLLREVLDDNQYLAIKEFLENSDFFTAPASTKFHLHCKGGLCQHSLNVYDLLEEKLDTWNLKYSDFTVRVVSLMHDWCKIDTYIPSTRRVPPERSGTGQWEVEEIWVKDDAYNLGHASKSIYLIQQFLVLTMEEIEAIHAHMGFGDLSTLFKAFDLGKLFTDNPLATCLHLADMESSYLLEDDLDNKEKYK